MSDIELVIKIPKELYEAYKGRPPMLGDEGMDMIAQSIKNGTPLPKNHGRLIDADALMDKVFFISNENESYGAVYAEDDIANAPIIIEGVKADDSM